MTIQSKGAGSSGGSSTSSQQQQQQYGIGRDFNGQLEHTVGSCACPNALNQGSGSYTSSTFAKCMGAITQQGLVDVEPSPGKPTCGLQFSGPETVKQAQVFYGCDKLGGMPLENTPIYQCSMPVGSHWEQNALSGEIMVQFANTRGVAQYVSPMTLALLQDTGWWKARYEAATRMLFGGYSEDYLAMEIQGGASRLGREWVVGGSGFLSQASSSSSYWAAVAAGSYELPLPASAGGTGTPEARAYTEVVQLEATDAWWGFGKGCAFLMESCMDSDVKQSCVADGDSDPQNNVCSPQPTVGAAYPRLTAAWDGNTGNPPSQRADLFQAPSKVHCAARSQRSCSMHRLHASGCGASREGSGVLKTQTRSIADKNSAAYTEGDGFSYKQVYQELPDTMQYWSSAATSASVATFAAGADKFPSAPGGVAGYSTYDPPTLVAGQSYLANTGLVWQPHRGGSSGLHDFCPVFSSYYVNWKVGGGFPTGFRFFRF